MRFVEAIPRKFFPIIKYLTSGHLRDAVFDTSVPVMPAAEKSV